MLPKSQVTYPSSFKTAVVELKGGINENVSSLELTGGELLNCKNYMMAEGGYGGYKSILGYERFDGIVKPSEYRSTVVTLTDVVAPITSGDVLVGSLSLETATALGNGKLVSGTYIEGDAVVTVETTVVSFTALEPILISLSTIGSFSLGIATTGGTDANHDAIIHARGLVQEVPGEGSILGLFVFESLAYAFRKKVGATQVGLYVESALGWTEIDTSADPLLYVEGQHDFRFTTFNFYATADTYSIYWTDCVNKARGFDGTSVITISNTGMGVLDVPVNIVAHNFYLFLVYPGGSLQYSILGAPTDWSVPGEIGCGNHITNLVAGVSGSLIIIMTKGISILTGTVASEFTLEVFSRASGAYPKTAQRLLGTVYFVDDPGVTTLEATDTFGDYSANSISQKFKETLQARLGIITGTMVSRNLNQMRIFFSDRTQIIMSFEAKELSGATYAEYNRSVDIVAGGQDTDGRDKNIFASKDGLGFVYRIDSGTSMDGTAITCRMSTAFYHYSSPRNDKAFKRATIEISADNGQTFNVKVDFNYNEADGARTIWYSGSVYNPEGGAIYGEGIWGIMKYGTSSAVTNRVPIYLQGVGTNMSYKIISNETYRNQHIIQNIITDYSLQNRRL